MKLLIGVSVHLLPDGVAAITGVTALQMLKFILARFWQAIVGGLIVRDCSGRLTLIFPRK